jgi:hypothetical protein
MKRFQFLALTLLLAMPGHAQWNYPQTKTVDASDTYFGKTYNDPYRWLENLKDKDVVDWFKAQAELTDAQLAQIPGRDELVQEWMALDKLQPAKTEGSFTRKPWAAKTWESSFIAKGGTGRKNCCLIQPHTRLV